MLTVEVAAVHTPLETVHTKELTPPERDVAVEDGLFIEVTEEPPESTDQAPLPMVGLTAANVAVTAQIV